MGFFNFIDRGNAYLWCAKKGVETLVSKKSNVYLYILVAIIFFVVKMPSSREFQDKLFTSANYVGYMLILWYQYY